MADSPKKNNDLKKEIDKSAKLFDVAKPGKSNPSSTSRPIIVGHAPMIKRDPMVTEEGSKAASEGPAPEAPEDKVAPHVARKIVPLGEKTEEESDESPELKIEVKKTDNTEKPAEDTSELPASDEISKDAPAAEEPEKEEPAKEEPVPEEPEANDSIDRDSSSAAVDALAGEVSAKREEQKQKEELAAKTAEVEKTIAAKEFFVPIGQESRRRSSNRILVGLVFLIILTLVTLNFAADAKLLDIGIDPLTDIM